MSEEIINFVNSDNLQVKVLVNKVEFALVSILETLLETIVIEDSNFMWSLSKPLLGFAIINEHVFERTYEGVVNKVKGSEEFKKQLVECCGNLMAGIGRNMKMRNKELFAKNFSLLRNLISSHNMN